MRADRGGTIGYSIAEHENLWNSFIWTVDTVATTGSIAGPTDLGGRGRQGVLTFLGVGTLFYALVSITELVVTGELGTLLAERRMRRMTERLKDHFIVCGFGRVGRQVAADLRAAGALYVVIDDDEANRDAAYAPGVRFIHARPSDDSALQRRGHRARPRGDRLRGLRRREHLHRPDRARAGAGHRDRRPRLPARRPSPSCAARAPTA